MVLLSIVVAFLTFYGIYTILALSMNLEYGFTGLPNFGKVVFYSAGAYTAAFVTGQVLTRLAGGEEGVCAARSAVLREAFAVANPLIIAGVFIAALILAALIGGLLGYVLSWPAIRIRDIYLGLLLMVVAEIGRVFVRSTPGIICGPHGLGGIPNPLSFIQNPDLRYALYALLVMIIAGLTYVFFEQLVNTPYGRLLKMVRDDEEAARALGKRTRQIKGQVMAIGSAMSAVAGVLYAFYSQFVGTEDFIPFLTFLILATVILGGSANNRGVLIGVFVLTAVDRLTRPSILSMVGIELPFDANYLRYALVGLLLTVLILYRPQGLFPETSLRTPAWKVVSKRETDNR